MKGHDDIILQLTDDNLKKLFAKYLQYKPLCFTYKKILEYNTLYDSLSGDEQYMVSFLQHNCEKYKNIDRYKALHQMRDNINEDCVELKEKTKELKDSQKTIIYYKEFEKLIYDVNNHNKIIGFADLFVNFSTISCGATFSGLFKNNTFRQNIVIDAKTEKEFDDVGQILRQIKRYKIYTGEWYVDSWILITPHTTKRIKEFFKENDIDIIELNELNSVDNYAELT